MSEWLTVARTGEIAPGAVLVVEARGTRLAICHVAEGEECKPGFYAIEDVCTHDGGELDQGELLGCQIECPRHGARFDVATGKAMCLPAITPVATFPLRVEGDQIQVAVETREGVR